MEYTIGEMSKLTGLSISKLRYYESQGLILNVNRSSSGIRKFSEDNISSLTLIECLKNSGMKLKEIKQFMLWCKEGNSSLKKRYNMFLKQEENILKQIDTLQSSLNLVRFKKWYYSKALQDNSDEYVKKLNVNDMPEDIKKLYNQIHSKKISKN